MKMAFVTRGTLHRTPGSAGPMIEVETINIIRVSFEEDPQACVRRVGLQKHLLKQ